MITDTAPVNTGRCGGRSQSRQDAVVQCAAVGSSDDPACSRGSQSEWPADRRLETWHSPGETAQKHYGCSVTPIPSNRCSTSLAAERRDIRAVHDGDCQRRRGPLPILLLRCAGTRPDTALTISGYWLLMKDWCL